MATNDPARWVKRAGGGYAATNHRRNGHIIEVHDNGGGLGPASGSGRWAVVVDGDWIANVDRLDAAKRAALADADARMSAMMPRD